MAVQFKRVTGLNTTSLNKLIQLSSKDVADKKYVDDTVSNVSFDDTEIQNEITNISNELNASTGVNQQLFIMVKGSVSSAYVGTTGDLAFEN